MEFFLNNKKYSVITEELLINYIMVDSYFKHFSKYDYQIEFDFLKQILNKDKITFNDIIEESKILDELIKRGEVNFIPYGLTIDEDLNGNFKISYQSLEFKNICAGEAIPFLIALTSLLNVKPALSLFDVEDELNHFVEKFRSYREN